MSTSRKRSITTGIFYSVSFIIGIIIPNIMAVAIAVKKTEFFCKHHKDICDQYYYGGADDASLTQNVKDHAYLAAGAGSFTGGIVASFAILAAILLPKYIYNRCLLGSQHQDKTPEEASHLLPHNDSANQCCRLFAKFRNNVLPTKFDIYQLLISATFLIGTAAYVAWYAAIIAQEDICSESIVVNRCDFHFQNATRHQLHEVANLADGVYSEILGVGIIFAAIVNIFISLATMGISAWVKYQMEKNIENRFQETTAQHAGLLSI